MYKRDQISKTYKKKSYAISVSVTPIFIEHDSWEEESYYLWAYHVLIENKSTYTLQLCRRYWKITDCYGKIQEITGEGVVGEKPILKPGEIFEYTSVTALLSPSGIMEGAYLMVDEYGKDLEIKIPAFSLDSPYDLKVLN
jgi:ApaG protein